DWLATATARTPELMEIFAAAPLGPLRDYDTRGNPLNGESFLSEEQKQLIDQTQKHILAASALWQKSFGPQLTAELGRCLWGRLLLRPLAAEAEALGDWPLDSGLNGAARRQLAPALSGQPQWTKMQTAWPAGSEEREAPVPETPLRASSKL